MAAGSKAENAMEKQRAPRNRTLTLTGDDKKRLEPKLVTELPSERLNQPLEGVFWGDCVQLSKHLPLAHVDLLFLDPPYNLSKTFNSLKFQKTSNDDYSDWLDNVVSCLKPLLKPTASIYICGDWLSSHSIFEVASKHFVIRNRITWEREKGRGAKTNWKNSSEDIWFCTMSNDYYFAVDDVKLRRKVIAPYKNSDGTPKDWELTQEGDFRDTHPSNMWTDISIPFWSMPENTDHPTQKSEKLLAKVILASSKPNDFVLDPFLGSGTTGVVASKLGRRFLGIDMDREYCLWAMRRLELASVDKTIQGYSDGVFWERNTLALQTKLDTVPVSKKRTDKSATRLD